MKTARTSMERMRVVLALMLLAAAPLHAQDVGPVDVDRARRIAVLEAELAQLRGVSSPPARVTELEAPDWRAARLPPPIPRVSRTVPVLEQHPHTPGPGAAPPLSPLQSQLLWLYPPLVFGGTASWPGFPAGCPCLPCR